MLFIPYLLDLHSFIEDDLCDVKRCHLQIWTMVHATLTLGRLHTNVMSWVFGSMEAILLCVSVCVCVLFTKFLSMFNGNQLLFFPATRNAFSDSSKKTLQKRLSINYQNRFKCMSIFTFLTMNFFSANKQPVARRYFLNTCIVSTEHPL